LRDDLKDFVFSFLDRLVSQNDIAFLKWDYNRNWSEPGWDAAPRDEQKQIYVKYVENLYDILDRLRERHPRLEIESCSGGGGGVDLGILRYTDEVWPSDNTDALDRLQIQDGVYTCYAPITMAAWVTDVPDSPHLGRALLQFRFLTAMQGALGIGGNLNHWTSSELQEGARLVSFYRQIRTTIQTGQLYRLIRPGEKGPTSVQYVEADGKQSVLFVYLRSKQFGGLYSPVRLGGLDPDAQYRIRCLNDEKYIGERTVSGALLMTRGISLLLHGDYDSAAVVLEREITPAAGEQ
jgi:alpha-galactosidase